MVYEIHDDGAIAKDDRLLCGDQILEVRLFAVVSKFYMFQNMLCFVFS